MKVKSSNSVETDGAQLDRAYLYTEYSTPSRASEEKKVG